MNDDGMMTTHANIAPNHLRLKSCLKKYDIGIGRGKVP